MDGASGLPMTMGVLFFAFQLYFDFSAYSQMAIGVARTLGFELTTNFRRPYLSSSFSEFWKRWHISLSSWFKDYVYIPLGGNRSHTRKTIFNVFIVFVLSGLMAWGIMEFCNMGICEWVIFSAFRSVSYKK